MAVVSLDEAAQSLRVSRSTVERLIKADVLPVVRLGRRVLVRRSDLKALVSRATEALERSESSEAQGA